jgi:hypothetical protein
MNDLIWIGVVLQAASNLNDVEGQRPAHRTPLSRSRPQ